MLLTVLIHDTSSKGRVSASENGEGCRISRRPPSCAEVVRYVHWIGIAGMIVDRLLLQLHSIRTPDELLRRCAVDGLEQLAVLRMLAAF